MSTSLHRRTRLLLAGVLMLPLTACTSSLPETPGDSAGSSSADEQEVGSEDATGEAPESGSDDLPNSDVDNVEIETTLFESVDTTYVIGTATNVGDTDLFALVGAVARDENGDVLSATDSSYLTLIAGASSWFVHTLDVEDAGVVADLSGSVGTVEAAPISGTVDVSDLSLDTQSAPMITAQVTSELSDTVRGARATAVCHSTAGDISGVASESLNQALAPQESVYIELPVALAADLDTQTDDIASLLDCSLEISF